MPCVPAFNITFLRQDESSSCAKRACKEKIGTVQILLDTNQVAKLTGYNIRTVNRWVTAGELKAIMTKPKNLFPKQYVLDFLISDFYESISVKSALHICHLNKIYQEYTELHTEEENKDEE